MKPSPAGLVMALAVAHPRENPKAMGQSYLEDLATDCLFFSYSPMVGVPSFEPCPSKKFSRDVVTARRFDLHPLDGWTSESHE